MSSKSFGGSVRSGAGSVRLGAGAHAAHAPHEFVLDALYERKRDKKTVRVLTVIIYVFSVSLAAIMLSLYYVFFWEPKDAQYAQRKVAHTVDQQTSTTPMPTCLMPHTGGGGIPVNESSSQTAPANIADGAGSPSTASSEEPSAATAPQYSGAPYATSDDHTNAWRADNSTVT